MNSHVCWFCMRVLGLILFQISAQVPFWLIDELIDWLIDVDWLMLFQEDTLSALCNHLDKTEPMMRTFLIDVTGTCLNTQQEKQVVYWNRLFFASQAGGLLKQTFLCKSSRWSIETDFSLQVKQVVYWNRLFFASQAGGLLKQTSLCKSSRWSVETDFSLQVKQVVYWNRLFSCKSHRWSFETDFSLASHIGSLLKHFFPLASQAGGLLKQTFLLQVKQVVYWNRLFSCKSSRWSIETDFSLASQAGGLLKQTFLLQVKQVVYWTDLSLASHTGGLLKQTFLLHIKQVVSWNRLFSFK